MGERAASDPEVALARALLHELLVTGLALGEALGSLVEDLPADAFPGEESAEVLLEMAAGTCVPVVRAVGERACRDALALIGAVCGRCLDDLRAAADASRHQRP